MIKILPILAFLVGYVFEVKADAPPEHALRTADRTAAVAAVANASETRATAYLARGGADFLKVDLSPVEGVNLGKLGRRRSELSRLETTPIEWLPRQDDSLRVRIRTRAWISSQRHTVFEIVLIRRDGVVVWR